MKSTYAEPGTTRDGWGAETSYIDVGALVSTDGWQNLVNVSVNDLFLRTPRDAAQPSSWNRVIKEREGIGSGAGIRIFRLTGTEAVELKTEFETPTDGIVNSDEPQIHNGNLEVRANDVNPAVVDKTIEIRARRGRGVKHRPDGYLRS